MSSTPAAPPRSSRRPRSAPAGLYPAPAFNPTVYTPAHTRPSTPTGFPAPTPPRPTSLLAARTKHTRSHSLHRLLPTLLHPFLPSPPPTPTSSPSPLPDMAALALPSEHPHPYAHSPLPQIGAPARGILIHPSPSLSRTPSATYTHPHPSPDLARASSRDSSSGSSGSSAEAPPPTSPPAGRKIRFAPLPDPSGLVGGGRSVVSGTLFDDAHAGVIDSSDPSQDILRIPSRDAAEQVASGEAVDAADLPPIEHLTSPQQAQAGGSSHDRTPSEVSESESTRSASGGGGGGRRWGRKLLRSVGLGGSGSSDKERSGSRSRSRSPESGGGSSYSDGTPVGRRRSTGAMTASSPFHSSHELARKASLLSGLDASSFLSPLSTSPSASSNHSSPGVLPGARQLNGRIWRRRDVEAQRRRSTMAAAEPEFVEWGFGGVGTTGTGRLPKAAGDGQRRMSESDESDAREAGGRGGEEDDGSGMGWVRRRREQRARETKEREEREREKREQPPASPSPAPSPSSSHAPASPPPPEISVTAPTPAKSPTPAASLSPPPPVPTTTTSPNPHQPTGKHRTKAIPVPPTPSDSPSHSPLSSHHPNRTPSSSSQSSEEEGEDEDEDEMDEEERREEERLMEEAKRSASASGAGVEVLSAGSAGGARREE